MTWLSQMQNLIGRERSDATRPLRGLGLGSRSTSGKVTDAPERPLVRVSSTPEGLKTVTEGGAVPRVLLGSTEGGDVGTATASSNGSSKRTRGDLPQSSRTIDRWGMNPEDRARVMESCLLLQRSGWKMNFIIMMLMAVIVAIMGLSANSAAVVIGAMLMAPLMTPVLGIAASIAMALGPALFRSLFTVVLASIGAIALGYLAGVILPDGRGLSSEILARTQPDVRDLAVAIAAGIAGSYATARPDTSSSLPGVAIAVALVPPLAVVGLTLEAGRPSLALGALLLYLTNLAAIIFASAIVFIATGFVPARRLASTSPRVILGALVALAALLFFGWRLTLTTIRTSDELSVERDVRAQVTEWLGAGNTIDELEVDTESGRVSIAVTGPTSLNPIDELEETLKPVLGDEVIVNATLAPVEAGRRSFTTDDVQGEIDAWIASNGGAEEWETTTLEVIEGTIVASLTTTGTAPSDTDELQEILQDRFKVQSRVSFTEEREVVVDPLSTEVITTRVESVIEEWAEENDLEVIGSTVAVDSGQIQSVEATVRGAVAPTLRSFEDRLEEFEGFEGPSTLWFVDAMPVLAPTPTPVPTPVPTPTPTPEASIFDLDFDS